MSETHLTGDALAARNAYQREYRKKNREKIREIENRYWAKKAAQMQQKGDVLDAEKND